jgi:hypothetical protein
MTEISKLTAYLATGPSDAEMVVSKLVAYVITGPIVKGALRILTWTFTLDDHDFLVIQLLNTTLVYDFHSSEWYTWGSGIADDRWQVSFGQNWDANLGKLMPGLGGNTQSNVICGDEQTGTLYFLDPKLVEDDAADGTPGQAFSRFITGQLVVRGHDYISCPGVELTGSTGQGPVGLVNGTVTLDYSDDRGQTYVTAGALTPDPGVFDVELGWYSLGSFTGPGRLFRITDYGALSRIDGLDMPNGQ